MDIAQTRINNWITNNNINVPLILSNLNLPELPVLPNNLKILYCDNNELTTLPELPNNLQRLVCDKNKLRNLPTLPNSLKILDCDDNKLTALPELPNSLQKLVCSYNRLSNLPILPNTLQELNCNNNKLPTLPTLPNNLQTLDCRNNQLTNLPILPNNLRELVCSYNQLTNLPNLPNSLQKLLIDSINLLNNTQIQFLLNNNVEVYDSNEDLIELLPERNENLVNNELNIEYKNNYYNNNNELNIEYKNNYYNNNNELNCGNDTTFLGDEIDNIDKIFLFLNEDTGKYNIYCYTTDELINTLLKAEKLYKWNKEIKDIENNWPGKPNLNKRVLKEPYTNSYINFDNLNKIIIYNCFLLKPTKKYRLGSGEANLVSRMHGRNIDIAMVYDVYPINYELIKNKVKISKDDIINFVPKLQDIDNRYNENLIITNLDEKTNNIIPDINSLNKDMNYQISNNKIQIINTKFYRQDILKDKTQYPNIINATEFIHN